MTQWRGEQSREHHGIHVSADSRDEDRNATAGAPKVVPITLNPLVRLHISHVWIHAQPHLHVRANFAAEVDALRPRIPDPQLR
ncbi:hypothetical protein D3C72_2316480 [compost metagenome]